MRCCIVQEEERVNTEKKLFFFVLNLFKQGKRLHVSRVREHVCNADGLQTIFASFQQHCCISCKGDRIA